MFSVRWRKVIRDVWGNKARSTLVVLSIAVGVFGVGMLASARVNLSRELNTSYASIRPAHAELSVEPFDGDLAESVGRLPGVAEAEARNEISGRLIIGTDRKFKIGLQVVPDLGDMRVNQLPLVSGAAVPALREMLVERRSLPYIGAKEGDWVVVETMNGVRRALRLAGVVHDLSRGSAEMTGLVSGYITPETLEWLGYDRKYTQLLIRVPGNPRDKQEIQTVADQVAAKVERGGLKVNSVFVREPGFHPAETLMNQVMLLLGALSLLALLLSGFLVVNIISAVLAQQVRQIGMMKAIGAQTYQVLGMYIGMVVVFALLALALAIPLGGLGACAFVAPMAAYFNVDAGACHIPSDVLAFQVGIGLAVPLLAAFFPILSGTRVTVYQAISDFGVRQGRFGASLIDRLCASPRLRKLPRPWLLAIRNTFRHKARLVFTMVTLVVASMTFVGVFGARASLLRTFDLALSYWQYDLALLFGRPYPRDRIKDEAMSTGGVLAVESWDYGSVRRLREDSNQGKEMMLVALPAQTQMVKPVLMQGRWLLPQDDNALVVNTDVLKEEPDIKVGDEVRLKIGDIKAGWQVVGVVLGVMSGPLVYANQSYYAQLMQKSGRANWVQVAIERHDPAFQSEMANALEKQFEDAGIRVTGTGIVADTRARVIQLLDVFTAILSVASLLLAAVGGLGLAGTMSVNVLERTREIGVMRAVGASNSALHQIVILESVIIAALSWLTGSILALPVGMLLTEIGGSVILRMPLQYAYSVDGAFLWLVSIAILAVVACLLPARAATRLTVREVLAYE